MMPVRVKLSESFTDIIIPTYDNPEYLKRCLYSILAYTGSLYKIHIVNNGVPKSLSNLEQEYPNNIRVYDVGKNLGWIGGINHVKNQVTGPFVMMLNDDTQVIHHDWGWLRRLQLPFFLYDKVGAVGPISNMVSGSQQMNSAYGLRHTAPWLSGFCLLTKKSVLDSVGWLDESLPGGDDLDLSIRMRSAGLMLVVTRDVTVFHNYATTGRRVHGAYWDSIDHSEAINIALIRKHGLKAVLRIQWEGISNEVITKRPDIEKDEILPWLRGTGLNLGCGDKEYPGAVGIDLVPYGESGILGCQNNKSSKAQIVANIEKRLPFGDMSQDFVIAQHILEHMINPIKSLKDWNRVLKLGGKLLVCVPDEDVVNGIMLDPTHAHVMDEEFLQDLVKGTGFKILELKKTGPANSLFLVGEKI